ncbi:MAG: TVP38/TMEM64 family protein, partial [Firmicutes bacterium]|nr:TVP38/TMEM64 family protein [Bacillota bacterium]
MKDPEDLVEAIQSYGHWGALIFIGIQIFQIVLPPIPGRVVQIAGGYIFGLWLGTLYLVIGSLLGSFIAFYAARVIGFPLVEAFVPPG